MRSRDLTREQYERKLARYGFGKRTLLGYRSLPAPEDHISVSEFNAPEDTNRSRLAYLLAKWREAGR